MLRTFLALVASAIVLSLASTLFAQDSPPVPTITPPTLVPSESPGVSVDSLITESAIADIINSGTIRVGLLYNDPPYSELTLRGELRGFDVDLLRKIASAWASELELVQVTRLNAVDKLISGGLHAVASAIVHYRDRDMELEFSQTYLQGEQALMVRAESPIAALADVSDQQLGYVIGTRSESALGIWSDRVGRVLGLQHYLTLDRAVAGLTRGEIAGVVAEKQALYRISANFSESIRILDEAVVSEAHAIAVRRQDAPLRDALNKTVQFLATEGELDLLVREYFPDDNYSLETVTVWTGIGDEVTPSQFATEIAYPSTYGLPRIKSSGSLRVGGIFDVSRDLPAGRRKLDKLNRALVSEMATRWGVAIEIVPSDPENAVELLSGGQVDLVVGVKPDWSKAAEIDFSMPYLLHGDRLMVRTNSGIAGFNDLRGRFLGVLIGDETARERAEAWADSINASVRFIQTTESDAALTLLDYNNANAIYADNLALLAHLEANPDTLRLTDRWYSRSYYTFGIPYNDLDLRLLVDYTVQELIADGTLYRLSAPLILSDELPAFETVPGASSFAGISLSRSSADSAP